tara:strand:- start:394 stop:1164 length:771 start_codon:yes stop_codon:yes gene_type:complete
VDYDLTVSEEDKLPPRLTLLSGPGLGKTTFGTRCPDPVFILTEEGCAAPVPKIPKIGKIEKWHDVLGAVNFLCEANHDRKTVIVDVVNQAEKLCRQFICDEKFGGRWMAERGKEGFNQWAQGDKLAATEFVKLLNKLDYLRREKRMFVVMLAHEGLHRHGNALGDDFQKIGGAMHKYTWQSVLEWSDQVGHVTKDFVSVTKQGERVAKQKGDNKRVCYFDGGPGRDAKSRAGYEMPEKINFSYDNYVKASNRKRTI